MKTIGHHTTKGEGNPEDVIHEVPFESTSDLAWLGRGYYFWDNDIDAAHHWGNSHCGGNYYIYDADLALDKSVFFDLVGNRQHIIDMTNYFEKFKSFKQKNERWTMRRMLDLLRLLENTSNYKGIFPYKAVRAVDSSVYRGGNVRFVGEKRAFINLNPKFIICLYEKDDLILRHKRFIYSSVNNN